MLAAMVLLAYALARYIDLPGRSFSFEFANIFIDFELNANTVVALVVAAIMAAGADWLIRGHPEAAPTSTLQHWVLPGLAALVLGVTLNSVEGELLWWLVFVGGAVLLILVLLAEYAAVDPAGRYYPLASGGLTALSYGLYLILAITLRAASTRLVWVLPALALSAILICIRYLYLQLQLNDLISPDNLRSALLAAATVGIIVVQLTTAFHYWTLNPLAFGLSVLAPAYAGANWFGHQVEESSAARAVLETSLILIALWIVAISLS
jgi:hypothetical protein